jgi:hypothetical protein
MCLDGIERWFFLCILILSADFEEQWGFNCGLFLFC